MKKFQYFFLREYRLRNLYISKYNNVIISSIGTVCNSISEHIKFKDVKQKIYYINLLIELHAKSKCNMSSNYSLTDYYYELTFHRCFKDIEHCRQCECLYNKIIDNRKTKFALNYLLGLCIKYKVYVTHIEFLKYKEYDVDKMLKNIEEYTENEFRWCVQKSKHYCLLSPSDCELEFDISNQSKWRGMHAVMLNINSKNFDVKKALEYIKSQIIVARDIYHLVNDSVMSEDERFLFDNIEELDIGSSFKIEGFQSRLIGLMLWDLKNLKQYNLKNAFFKINNEIIDYPKFKRCEHRNDRYKCNKCERFKKCFKYIELLYDVADKSIKKGKIISSNKR